MGANGRARCILAGKTVAVPRTDLVTFGFSCKSLSTMNSSTRTTLADKGSTSGSTFWGGVQVIAATKPKIVIIENAMGLLGAWGLSHLHRDSGREYVPRMPCFRG